jgi:acyl carrier protein
MTNLEKYDDIFIQIFKTDKTNLNGEFTIENVDNWDSFTQMQLIAVLEDTFNFRLDTDDFMELVSYENGKSILKKHKVEL